MMTTDAANPRFYGRRKGRPLRTRKSRLMDELLPKLEIKLDGKCSPENLFRHKPKSFWLEIGFGGGEHLAAQAMKHADKGFIGCEPFVNGIASALDHIEREGITNVRLFPNDARLLLDALPDACIERCYVLFADPWPKAKHIERRFIGSENVPRLVRVIKPDGTLHLATDDRRLADWMFIHMRAAKEFEEIYNKQQPPEEWVPTRYEQKALKAGRQPVYRIYRRKD